MFAIEIYYLMKSNGKIQLYPLLRIAIFLILGILTGYYFYPFVPISWSVTMMTVLLVVMIVLRKYDVLQSIFIMLTTFCLGIFLVTEERHEMNVVLPENNVYYNAVVESEPVDYGKTVRCDLLIVNKDGKTMRIKASILKDTVAYRYKHLHVGDGIGAFSRFEKIENFSTSSFDYKLWSECHGFVAKTFIYFSDWEKTVVDLRHLSYVERTRLSALKFRQSLIQHYKNYGLNGQNMAVVVAMTLGDKSLLSPQTKDIYSKTGASHVLALSGLHFSIIYSILLLLSMNRKRSMIHLVVMMLAIWSYAILVGLAPSVVRSAVMLSLYSLAALLNRNKMSVNTLSLAAIIMLVANPMNIFDVGFQMSFFSVLSIIIFFKPIYSIVKLKYIEKSNFLKWIWGLSSVSIAAQIGVAPLVAFYFGRFSCYFLLTNFIVIPCVYIILYASVTILFLSFVPVFQQIIISLLYFVVNGLNHLLTCISELPGACISELHPSVIQIVILYVLMGCFYIIAQYMKKLYSVHNQFNL